MVRRKRIKLFLTVMFFVAVIGVIGINAYYQSNQHEYGDWLFWQKVIWMQAGKNPEYFESVNRPFITSPPGWKTFAIGIVFLWSYIVIMAVYFYDDSPDKHRYLKASIKSLLLILPLAISPLLVVDAKASTPVTPEVDVLMYFDEEAQSEYHITEDDFFFQMFLASSFGDTTHEKFLYNFNINFRNLNSVYMEHYEYWSSPNELTDSYYLLQHAIMTHGGVNRSGEWVWEPQYYTIGNRKYLADLLLFVTGQTMDISGFSRPEWNALIIKYDAGVPILMHELSHQFNMPGHCNSLPGGCVMNSILATGWCSSCHNTIYANREAFGLQIQSIRLFNADYGHIEPEGGYYYEVFLGKPFVIRAYPDSGMQFDYWYIWLPSPEQYIYGNATLTINVENDNYWIWPHFSAILSGGGGGGGGHYLRC